MLLNSAPRPQAIETTGQTNLSFSFPLVRVELASLARRRGPTARWNTERKKKLRQANGPKRKRERARERDRDRSESLRGRAWKGWLEWEPCVCFSRSWNSRDCPVPSQGAKVPRCTSYIVSRLTHPTYQPMHTLRYATPFHRVYPTTSINVYATAFIYSTWYCTN